MCTSQICNCSPGISVGEGGLKKKQLGRYQRRGPGQTAFPGTETGFTNTYEINVSIFQNSEPWVSKFTFLQQCEGTSLPGSCESKIRTFLSARKKLFHNILFKTPECELSYPP